MKPRNWKTTTWGVLGMIGTIVGAALHFHQTGQFDLQATLTTLGALAAAIGLLPAADASSLQK
jgi:hypothetical protein